MYPIYEFLVQMNSSSDRDRYGFFLFVLPYQNIDCFELVKLLKIGVSHLFLLQRWILYFHRENWLKYLKWILRKLLFQNRYCRQQSISKYNLLNKNSWLLIKAASSSTTKTFANGWSSDEPIATPSFWIYVLLLNVKCTFLYINTTIHYFNFRDFNDFFDDAIKIVFMVSSNEAFAKIETTTNDTII